MTFLYDNSSLGLLEQEGEYLSGPVFVYVFPVFLVSYIIMKDKKNKSICKSKRIHKEKLLSGLWLDKICFQSQYSTFKTFSSISRRLSG